jgi:hypothetical protein
MILVTVGRQREDEMTGGKNGRKKICPSKIKWLKVYALNNGTNCTAQVTSMPVSLLLVQQFSSTKEQSVPDNLNVVELHC